LTKTQLVSEVDIGSYIRELVTEKFNSQRNCEFCRYSGE